MEHTIRCPPLVANISPCCRYHTTYQVDYSPQASQRYGFYRAVDDENVCGQQTCCTDMCEPPPSCRPKVAPRPEPVDWVAVACKDLCEPRIMPMKLSPEQRRNIELVVAPGCAKRNRFYGNSMCSTYRSLYQRLKHEEELQKYMPLRNEKGSYCLPNTDLCEVSNHQQCRSSHGFLD